MGPPLYIAAQFGNASVTVTEHLIAARCNIDLQTKRAWGRHEATHRRSLESMLLPLQQPRVDLQTENTSNALHVAAHLGHAVVAAVAPRCGIHLQKTDGSTRLQMPAVQAHAPGCCS